MRSHPIFKSPKPAIVKEFKTALKSQDKDTCLHIIASNEGFNAGYGQLLDVLEPYLSQSDQDYYQPVYQPIEFALFLNCAAKGQIHEVKRMLERNPTLLLFKGRVVDFSGRTLEGTGFQIALGAGMLEMCDAMHIYFDRIEEGRAYARAQYDDQFPNGEITAPAQAEYNFNYLMQLFLRYDWHRSERKLFSGERYCQRPTIDKSLVDDAFKLFLKQFCLNKDNIIRTGLHFNIKPFIQALDVYAAHAEAHWTAAGLIGFWKKIIGFLERQLPACDAQAICEGIEHVGPQKIAQNHTLKLSSHYKEKPIVYYPLDMDEEYCLGKEFAFSVDMYKGGEASFVGFAQDATRLARRLENLYEVKIAGLRKLRKDLQFEHGAGFAETARCSLM